MKKGLINKGKGSPPVSPLSASCSARLALACAVALCASGCGIEIRRHPTLSYKQILKQMSDPLFIADLEQPGAVLFASTDPTGGNDDFGNFVKDGPKGWKILAQVKGSGYISRFWCTGSKDGEKRIRIYADDERTPKIETTLDEWFGRRGFQDHLPLRGYNPYCWFSWIPISFGRSLTVMQEEASQDEKLFYQINVNLLPDGQIAETWRAEFLNDPEALGILEDLKAAWLSLQTTELTGMGEPVIIEPDTEKTLWQTSGANIFRELRLKADISEELSVAERENILRSLVVLIYWDGAANASVKAPLGAFGGSMWREIQYDSAYFGMAEGVFRVSFPMPFRNGCRVAVLNQGRVAVPVSVAARLCNCEPRDSLGYFHANWRKSTAEMVGNPHVIVHATGRGKYVGCQLGVRSLDPSWWVLESDEVMYVDGEESPSWSGTGLEDYFNGGWYYANTWVEPFHGIVFKAVARAQQYRIHPFDPVSFSNQFRMEFERGPGHVSHAEMESVAYYYQSEPAAADSDLGALEYRTPVDDPLAAATLMTEVLNMERLGDVAGAINTIRDYKTRYPDNPFNETLERRILHYHDPPKPQEGRGILGIYANAPTRVFLDGNMVLAVKDSRTEQVLFNEVNLPPGEHSIAIWFAYRPFPDWVQLMLEYPGGFLGTDNTWRYAFNPPGMSWARPNFDDSAWQRHSSIWVQGPPTEPYIWCAPNDRPWTQSKAWGIRPPVDWPPERRYVVFRRNFTVEPEE